MSKLDEILKASIGVNADGTGKAIVLFGLLKEYYDETAEPIECASHSCLDAIVDITKAQDISYVDLEFSNSENVNMSIFYSILEKFSAERKEDEFNVTAYITIIPKEYRGQYNITCITPLTWNTRSRTINSDKNILSVAFLCANVLFNESVTTDLDFSKYVKALDFKNRESLLPVDEEPSVEISGENQ